MPVILDSLFHKVVVAGPSNSIQEDLYGQMTSIQAVFGSTYHKM